MFEQTGLNQEKFEKLLLKAIHQGRDFEKSAIAAIKSNKFDLNKEIESDDAFEGKTLLLAACYFNRLGIVNALLDAGANGNELDNNGNNALQLMFFGSYQGIFNDLTLENFKLAVKKLIEKGVDPDSQNNEGKSLLNILNEARNSKVKKGNMARLRENVRFFQNALDEAKNPNPMISRGI